MSKLSFPGLLSTTVALIMSVLTTVAVAQQRPPTVTNVPPSELRLPTTDETGLWQLLSHQNDPNAICGGDEVLAVMQSTGQVVCTVPMRKECQQVTAAIRDGHNSAQQRVAEIQAKIQQEMSAHADAISELNAAEIKDNQFQRLSEATKDPQERLRVLKEQLEHKKMMLALVRQRDQIDKKLDQLDEERRRAQTEATNAQNNLTKVKTTNVECAQNKSPTGWLAQRHEKAMEYALESKTVRALLEDVLLKEAMTINGIPPNAADIIMATKAQLDRVDYAKKNGLDVRFWRESVAEITETVLVQTVPGIDSKLTASKIGAAFATAYVYGFAVGQ
jgi:hypothetical protein